MVLADPNHPSASRVHDTVRITQPSRPGGLGRDWDRHCLRLLAVKTLVGVVAEINDAAAYEVRAAAILMDAASHAESLFTRAGNTRGKVGRAAVRCAPDDD